MSRRTQDSQKVCTKLLSLPDNAKKNSIFSPSAKTRTTHAHDASRRSKRHARMGRAAQVSGVARFTFSIMGVQRTVQNNGNVKSEPKYLACEESPVRAFYF